MQDKLLLICKDGMVKEKVLPTERAILEAFHRLVPYSVAHAIAHEGWTIEDVDGVEVAGWTRAEMRKAVA